MIGSRKNYRDGSGVYAVRLTELIPGSQAPIHELYIKQFTEGRFGPYLNACDGSATKAMELYDWNVRVSASLWELLTYLEVALRNLIDERLQRAASTADHWTTQLEQLGLAKDERLKVELRKARKRIQQNGKVLTGGQTVSELPFGFWVAILSRKSRNLWPELASGFLGMPTRQPTELHRLVLVMHNLRNRIGHHHRVWNLDISDIHRDLLTLASFIDIEFGAWLSSKSQVPQRLAEFEEIMYTRHPDTSQGSPS